MNENLFISWAAFFWGITLHDVNMIAGTVCFLSASGLSLYTIYEKYNAKRKQPKDENGTN